MDLKEMTLKCPLFFLLFAIATFTCYGQRIPFNSKDTLIPMSALFDFKQTIYRFKNEARVQQYELNVYKALGKVDSLRYGTDSLITLFISRGRQPLLRVKQKHLIAQDTYDDSTVFYYNKKGLIEYSEMWETGSKKTLKKMKLTCYRYEYDDQNRLIRLVASFPTPRAMEYIYRYDSSGNVSRDGWPMDPFKFWDEIKMLPPIKR